MATAKTAVLRLIGNIPNAPFIPESVSGNDAATRATVNVQLPGGSLPGGTATGVQGGFFSFEAAMDVPAAWAASTVYATSSQVLDSNGQVQQCITGGTSGGSAPTWNEGLGEDTTDNSVTWQCVGTAAGSLAAGECIVIVVQGTAY